MALIGPEGNDLPDVLADGVNAYDFMAISGRALTDHRREAFDESFGAGLVQAVLRERLSAGAIQRRLSASFAGDPGYVGVDSLEITIGGAAYTIDLTLEAHNGSS